MVYQTYLFCALNLRATSFAERLRLGLAVIHGEQKEPESERLDGRQSPPPALAESRKFAYTFTDNAMDLPGKSIKFEVGS